MDTDRRGDDFFEVYTKDLTGEDVQRLFTRDAPRRVPVLHPPHRRSGVRRLSPLQRFTLRARLVFLASR